MSDEYENLTDADDFAYPCVVCGCPKREHTLDTKGYGGPHFACPNSQGWWDWEHRYTSIGSPPELGWTFGLTGG